MNRLMELLRKIRWTEVPYWIVALISTAPAWIVKYPPLEDLPTHLTTMRVIRSLHDPFFGLDTDFFVTFAQTQYLVYYLAGTALGYVIGIYAANVVLMSFYLGGTSLAVRSLLRALGRDDRASFLVIPLLMNVMFLLGLLPFMLAIPIMFFGLAAAVRLFHEPSTKRGIVLGALSFILFFTHLFPFGLFGIGVAAIFPWTQPRRWKNAILPFLPTVAAIIWFLTVTATGHVVRGTRSDGSADVVAPLGQALSAAYSWTTDVFRDNTDETVFIALIALSLFSFALAQASPNRPSRQASLLLLIPLVCFFLYFVTPDQRGPIWLFSQRFPILVLITLIPFVPIPTGWRGHLVAVLAVLLSVGSTTNICSHFLEFQRTEVGDFDGALASMEPRKRVVALIFDKGSNTMQFAPFLNWGSYYQFTKGGVVEFTSAGKEQCPFAFKPGKVPPQGVPPRRRWEWTPEQVPISELHPYFDYVLVRGSGFSPPVGTFHLRWHGDRWSVWEKNQPESPAILGH